MWCINAEDLSSRFADQYGIVLHLLASKTNKTIFRQVSFHTTMRKEGFPQEVLAERIGKSVNFVGQVEGTGTVRGVSLETLFKIAQVLNIPPAKLLEDD